MTREADLIRARRAADPERARELWRAQQRAYRQRTAPEREAARAKARAEKVTKAPVPEAPPPMRVLEENLAAPRSHGRPGYPVAARIRCVMRVMSGERLRDVAADEGITPTTLRQWMRRARS